MSDQPTSTLPTKAECLKFLLDSKNSIFDPDHRTWLIGGVEYPEDRAVMLAEYCLITGQAMTSLATIEAALNLARRVTLLEAALRSLSKDHTDHLLTHVTRKHWWSRG